MSPDSSSRLSRLSPKGVGSLVIALAVVVVLLVGFPAYRWFFLVSVVIGVGVWGLLQLWHRHKPIEAKDVENKRPLGLD